MRFVIHSERKSYEVSGIGVFIILATFTALLPYTVSMPKEVLVPITSIAAFGTVLGILAGPVKLTLRLNADSVIHGLIGFGVLGITSMVVGLTASLSTLKFKYVFIVAAVCEELGFRFGLQRFAERLMGPSIALIFQAGIFMLYHWLVYPGYELVAAYPLIAGLILGAVNSVSRDLTAPLIAHVMNNALVILMG